MAIPTPTFQLGGSAGWGTKAGKLLAQSQYLGSNGNNLYKPVSIDATRNSGGWRINKDGLWERRNDNVPRITFENNANGALLSEDSAVNLISSPTDFTTDWVTNGATVDSNVAIAPDGTMTADRINLINNTGAKIEQQINYSSGINLSAGVWLKSESGNVTIRWSGGAV